MARSTRSKRSNQSALVSDEPELRLSPLRLTIAFVILIALVGAGVLGYQTLTAKADPAADKWFAGYVDVTATPSFAFESASNKAANDVVLSFVVANPKNACQPSWGGAYSLDQASASLDLDRRIARLEQKGGGAIVSFGGQKNDELATACTDAGQLLSAYSSVVTRYSLSTVDLDIEGASLSDPAAASRRATAIATLQADRRAAGHPLAVWLTLPVSTTGLGQSGTDQITAMLKAGVDIAGVNAMTMDFGKSKPASQSMAAASEAALTATQRQLGVLYDRAKIPLSSRALWAKIGATPMIGQNDDAGQIFTLADAKTLNDWARQKGISRMSMWSLNRDVTCGSNYVDLSVVSDSCSGVAQKGKTFVSALSAGFPGHSELAASAVTTADPTPTAIPTDNPATSPYPIWSEDASYLQGTKIVWHHNVYVAKWWTQGDVPDNPVLNSWETPWTLVGPVLPGETPVPQPTLAPGTYPNWSGESVYDANDRVLFKGVPYESKWWNQGQSPAASTSDPDGSPWVKLTQQQIDQVQNSSAPIAPSAPTSDPVAPTSTPSP
jgi:chitinase